MQEQLSLRPAEFVKIRDGFIVFLKQPAGTPIELIIPQEVLDAMASAARRGRKRCRWLDTLRGVGIFVAAIGALWALTVEPNFPGLVLFVTGGASFVWANNRSKIRTEPEIEQLVTEPNDKLQQNLRALDGFRNLIASGDIPCEERPPDGPSKRLEGRTLQAFTADHGALLILSRDQELWRCNPYRPIPMSAIWVKVGDRVATAKITARTILETADDTLFERRTEWLLNAANQQSRQAESFRADVCVLQELRRLKKLGKTLEDCKQALASDGYGSTRVAHMNAGIYVPFEKFLAKLPLHDFP
jgi:hypothetical protein